MKEILKRILISVLILASLCSCQKSTDTMVSSFPENTVSEYESETESETETDSSVYEEVSSEEVVLAPESIESPVSSVVESVAAPVTPVPSQPEPIVSTPVRIPSTVASEGLKAIWLSQYDLNSIYTASGKQRGEKDFNAKIKIVLDNIKSNGFNTIFLQVRPNADSMYPSSVFPMSKYVVGKYGAKLYYDPIKIIITEAHARGLDIHAWINPLRAVSPAELELISTDYKIRSWYDNPELNGKYIVLFDNKYYLNPAYSEVRQLIIDGAKEILANYEFDGLHMDDYFYPTTDSTFDESAYADYKANGGTLELADFRRNALNELVSALYSATKQKNTGLLYGISPTGHIDQVYGSQYADIYTWCSNNGYIDYICPQVYFGFEHETCDFVKVCNTYQDIIKTDTVTLVIGMSLGKALMGMDYYAGTGMYEWRDNKNILSRAIQYTKELEKCIGVSIFCYQYFYKPLPNTPIPETAEEIANLVPTLKSMNWNKE